MEAGPSGLASPIVGSAYLRSYCFRNSCVAGLNRRIVRLSSGINWIATVAATSTNPSRIGPFTPRRSRGTSRANPRAPAAAQATRSGHRAHS
jgi:hypothetical protein